MILGSGDENFRPDRFNPENRVSKFFGDRIGILERPCDEVLFNQDGIKVVQVNRKGKKVDIGLDQGLHSTQTDFKPNFQMDERQKEFLAMTNIKRDQQERRDYFSISLLLQNDPDILDKDINLGNYFDKIAMDLSMADAMLIPALAEFYADEVQESDRPLADFYHELLELTAHAGDEKLSTKFSDLIEEVNEREAAGADAFVLKPLSLIENQALAMNQDTELSADLIAEFMNIQDPDEIVLFNQLRSLHTENFVRKTILREEPLKPQDDPHFVKLANAVANKAQIPFIYNVSKVASDLDRADDIRFVNFGERLLAIASNFKKPELAIRIFDIMPNTHLKDEKRL